MNAHVGIPHPLSDKLPYAWPDVRKYKLRMSDYLLLDEAGTFEGHETELVDGDVIVISPEWIPHMRVKDELAYQLRRSIERKKLDLLVGTGGSVALSEVNTPRPDVIVARQFAGDRSVKLDWVSLLAEVSSSTLTFDIGKKAVLYARFGIPEYWVADVNARLIIQMWSPLGDAYRERREVPFGKRITAATIDGLTINTMAL
ncbi:Uma2 family endonuclease [uncultured Sphingomonas sp.]|uniref:Uma2 family endonuclease n=1 Tax=uncultured Sphingomonas sp. TaxID=158754 RepID=UPI0035CAC2B1